MEDYYEYLDSNGVTTLYKLIKDDTVALIDSYSVTINGITTNLDNHVNNADIHTPIATIEGMIDTAVGSLNYATPDYVDIKVSGLVNSAPETLDTLKELSDALGNDSNFATTVANQIGSKANKDDVYTKGETDTLLEGKASSVHSHVVSDITDFPTIPTKVSDLTNDSGYITGVAWGDITSKPVLSQVAISGSYSDLSDTPTIPTKVSQLENDMGFGTGGDTSDCVHKTGDETINGIKTFTSGPYVTNNGTTIGYYIKNTAIGRGEIPSEIYHNTFRVHDKRNRIMGEFCVEKSTTGSTLAQINVRSEDANGKQIYKSVYFNMSNDGTTTAFHPNVTNEIDLGMAHYKWANAYIDRVVCTRFTHSVNNGSVYITGGSEWDKGANLTLHGEESSDAGTFVINSRDKTRSLYLVGKPDGTLQWAGQNIALDGNLVHKTGDETINGVKTFTASPFVSNYAVTNGFFTKLNTIARNEVPSQIHHSAFRVFDKNSKTLGECCVEKSTSGSSLLHLDVHTEDSEGNDIMESLYLNLSNDGSTVSFHPAKNNRTDLGMSGYKWAKIYSDDVVHTSGNETINGTKTFTSGPVASNSATTNGYSIKNTAIARNDVPSELYHATFRAYDKNGKILGEYCVEKSTTGCTLLNMNVRSEDSNGKQLSEGLCLNMSNDGSVVRFYPSSNNKMDLGMSSRKWAKVYSDDVVHTSGNETIFGDKTFTQNVNIKNNNLDLSVTPTNNMFSTITFRDKNNKSTASLQNSQRTYGVNDICFYVFDADSNSHGFRIRTDNTLEPIANNTYSLGSSSNKWANVYATTFNGNLSGTIASSTTATTQATTDNSTKIATTAWVRTYVNSVVGSGSVGASISAYYSNATTKTAEGSSSSSTAGYPADYSDYINIAPTVGTIYTGSQLFSSFTPTASGTINKQSTGSGGTAPCLTTAKATATFSGAFSASAKYLCTTANAVKFRAFVSKGTSSAMGSPSVVDNSSSKSIFIRVQ